MSGKAQNREKAFNTSPQQPGVGPARGPSRAELPGWRVGGWPGRYLLKRPLGCVGTCVLWSLRYSDLTLWPVPAAASPPESPPLLHLALPSRQFGRPRIPDRSNHWFWLSQPLLYYPCPPVFPAGPTKPQKFTFEAKAEIAVQAWVLEESFQGPASGDSSDPPPTPAFRFSGSQHCGHIHCAYQYREHYHCLDPECNYQVWATLRSPASTDSWRGGTTSHLSITWVGGGHGLIICLPRLQLSRQPIGSAAATDASLLLGV